MSTGIFIVPHPSFAGASLVPTTRGPMTPAHGVVIGLGRFPTDSVGVCDIEIQNAIVGSRWRIEITSTGQLVAEGDVVTSDFFVSVPFYKAGNTNNILSVKVRKGTTAPKYQPFRTQVTAKAGGALAYISQVPDNIA